MAHPLVHCSATKHLYEALTVCAMVPPRDDVYTVIACLLSTVPPPVRLMACVEFVGKALAMVCAKLLASSKAGLVEEEDVVLERIDLLLQECDSLAQQSKNK